MKKYILLAATLGMGLVSCDMLNKEPLDKLSPEVYFKTETDLQLFTNTFYNNLLDKSPYNEQSDQLVQQILSDEILGGENRIVPGSGGGWSWGDLRKMNTLLEYAPKQCEDPAALLKYTALTRFFRAYFYFEKIKRFGDVPWYDKQLESDDPDLYKPRDSREYVMTKMIEDIDFAAANLPSEKFASNSSGPFRVNRWAALALKARFCLYEGTYRKYHGVNLDGNDYKYYLQQAVAAAQEIMEDGPYKLHDTDHPEQDYLNLFTAEDANTDEYILAIKFDYGLAIHHNGTAYSLVPSQGMPGFTKKIVNTYLMKDGTPFTSKPGYQQLQFADEMKDRDPRLAQTIRGLGYHRIGETAVIAPKFEQCVTGYQPIKWVQEPTASGGQVDRNDRSTNDLPVFRYAEVLLNYAEAKAELGTITDDDLKNSVNLIRDRAGIEKGLTLDMCATPDPYLSSAEYGFSNVTGAGAGIILEIRRERTVELAQEGFRYNDIVRWKAGNCLNQEIYGMYFPGPGEYDLTGDGKADLCLYTDEKPETSASEAKKIGEDIFLSEDTKGFVEPHKNIVRNFNESRDYLYPIPRNERSLNNNLIQNPGWNDGLSF